MIPSPSETRASLILRLKDAEDVVQEVFVAVAKSIGSWIDQPHRGRFRSWLLGISRNIAINTLTRRPPGALGAGGTSIEPLAELAHSAAPLTEEFDLEFRREVYRGAADQVRESVALTTWRAFEMTHVQGTKIPNAAEQLGITVGNVYIARSRVMNRLREMAKQFEVSR